MAAQQGFDVAKSALKPGILEVEYLKGTALGSQLNRGLKGRSVIRPLSKAAGYPGNCNHLTLFFDDESDSRAACRSS